MRIVSLLPSATEIVCGIGLRDSLVAVTHECDYPADLGDLPKVTRTRIPQDIASNEIDSLVRDRLENQQSLYSLNTDVLTDVQPDLIITQTLCEVCAVAESEVAAAIKTLARPPRIINLEPNCLQDVFECIHKVGVAARVEDRAATFVNELRRRVQEVNKRSESLSQPVSVVLLEWIDPPFSAGHWSPELVELAGGRDAFGISGERSTTIDWDDFIAADPEVLVLTCCGFDVKRILKDLPILRSKSGWNSLRCVHSQRVYVIDGSAYFNRPGPRLVDSLEILANALHPELHLLPTGLIGALQMEVDDLLPDS